MSFRPFHATPERSILRANHVILGLVALFLTTANFASISAQEKDQPAAEKAAETKPADDQGKTESKPAEKKPEQPAKSEGDAKEKAKDEPKQDAPEKDASEKDAPEKEAAPAKPQPDPVWLEKGVWTLPPTDGPAATDFSLVGEYAGDITMPTASKNDDEADNSDSTGKRRFGVQIRTLGSGQFEALAYEGGLPGDKEFDESTQLRLIGRRNGDTLVLSGGPWALFAGPEQCRLINMEGASLGDLPRVNRTSPTMGAKAPENALVLFDGTNTDEFTQANMDDQKLLKQGANINWLLTDFDLHLEYRIPHMPGMQGQKRGNSGIYLQSRYECQILDSFGTERVFNGLGALYRFKPPRLNMAFPPLVWQTYDVQFTAARFGANGKKLRPAHVTSWVNGVKVQDNVALPGPTGAGKDEEALPLQTFLQNHTDPVRFRNVWVVDRGLVASDSFPVKSEE